MKSTFGEARLSMADVYFFRQRLKNKIFQSALAYFVDVAKERNLTKKDIAKLLDKDPAQITRWFSGPNNWTLDTISDLLLAMGAEMTHEIVSLDEFNQETADFKKAGELSVNPDVPQVEVREMSAEISMHTTDFAQIRKISASEQQYYSEQIGINGEAQASSYYFEGQNLKSNQCKATSSALY